MAQPITDAQRAARQANAAKASEGRKQAIAARRAESVAALESAGVPRYEVSEARLMAAKAELAELDVEERRGELISIEQARADVLDRFATVRMRVLGVPSRVAQRMPALGAEVVSLVDELLREALDELANDDPADDE